MAPWEAVVEEEEADDGLGPAVGGQDGDQAQGEDRMRPPEVAFEKMRAGDIGTDEGRDMPLGGEMLPEMRGSEDGDAIEGGRGTSDAVALPVTIAPGTREVMDGDQREIRRMRP